MRPYTGVRRKVRGTKIESTIKSHQRVILLAGQTADNDLQVGGNYVYAGTGGAAPNLQNHTTKLRNT